ncbi:hypothetical protein AVEN_229028-1 [Araneus ventricosus]|uniref:MATH domain-containing protein n=1 Tax=Araneus ventricosus TaxID=182803 RepID=A0A4Y2KMV3_ARAVE|nr:hypothetical protein AVEN_229028-1 [Araneus ventricosus]
MAANNDQGVRINEIEVVNGHNVHFLVSVRNLVAMQSRPLILEHFNNCRNFPTSWRLRIVYEQEPETGKVSCSVSLTRTDFGNGYVNISVSVSYLDNNDGDFRFSEEICNGQMFSGSVTEGYIEEKRHPGYISHIFSLGLILRISMHIRYCHAAVKIYA